ncbi:MAG: hypothetical protein WEG36_15195 [Gemmatimonadota bacterium]
MFSQSRRVLLLAALLVAATGCQDLVVRNLNDPDRFRAITNPEDVQQLIAGVFDEEYFPAIHLASSAVDTEMMFAGYASEMTATTVLGGTANETAEPRQEHSNLVSIATTIGVHGPRNMYRDFLRVWSVADDILRLTQGEDATELIIGEVDQTPRARAFAMMMQGFAWGYLANMFDQAMIIPSDEVFPESNEEALQYLVDRDVALEASLSVLDDAKALLLANPDIVYPDRSAGSAQWFGAAAPVGPAELIPFINTMQARFLIMHARNPAERAAVNWTRVLTHTTAGLQSDFSVVLDGSRPSGLYSTIARGNAGMGADYRMVGPADISGGYQSWIAAGLEGRDRFQMVTPDRRIQGPGFVVFQSVNYRAQGAYFRNMANSLSDQCCGASGTYYRPAYQWRRHQHGIGIATTVNSTTSNFNTGDAEIATADENRLYAAEANFHMGNLTAARDLVNVTRTRGHTLPNQGNFPTNLPPATVNGAPHSAPGADDCVPRTDTGQCGNLHVVIRYERMIELAGLDVLRGWFDSRAFGTLPDGSWTQLPVPAPELEQLGLPLYSFGGVGTEFGAVYAPVGGGWNGGP